MTPQNSIPPFEYQYLSPKREKEGGLDRFLKLTFALTVLISCLFTGERLSGIWGFDTLLKQFCTVVVAMIVTAVEIYGFRLYRLEDDFLMLALGCLMALGSITGNRIYQTWLREQRHNGREATA